MYHKIKGKKVCWVSNFASIASHVDITTLRQINIEYCIVARVYIVHDYIVGPISYKETHGVVFCTNKCIMIKN